MNIVSHDQTTINIEKSKQFSADKPFRSYKFSTSKKPYGTLMAFFQYELHFIIYCLKSYFISIFTNS